jgi:hypothetical protein
MKRKFLFLVSFLLLASIVNSCEAIIGCKKCQDVTYEDGKEVFATLETEYCGDELIKKESIPDTPVGNQILKVECH